MAMKHAAFQALSMRHFELITLPTVYHGCHGIPILTWYYRLKMRHCHIFDYFQGMKPKIGAKVKFRAYSPNI